MAELLVQLVHSVNGIVSSLKLAVGYLLDELKNDITRETPASFEPSIDYVVTNPESFRGALCLRGAGARPPFHKPPPRSPRR